LKLEYEKKGTAEKDKSESETYHKTDDKREDSTVSWRTVVLCLAVVILVLIFIYIRWPKR